MYSYIKFTKHIFIISFVDLLGILQSLIFLPIITKILGAENYGIWSQLKITMGLLVPFTFLGLHEALIRFLPGTKDNNDLKEGIYSSFFTVFLVTLIIALLLIIFAKPISSFFQFDRIYVKFLSFLIIFESLNIIFLVVVRSLREIGKYFWFMSFRMIGEIILVISAILLGYGLYGAVFSFLLIRILTFLILMIYVFKKVGVKFPNFSIIKNYLKFGLPTIADHLSYWVITSIDRYFIGFFLGVLFVGYYAPAYSIGTLLTFFIFPMAFMLSTILPKLFDENNLDEVKNYLSYSLKYFLLLIIPSVFGLSILSKQLLIILSTKDIADNSYFVVPFVVISIFLYGVSYFFSQILVLKKKTKIIAFIWLVSAILNFVLNIIFIPKFGILAAAITTLSAYLCAFLLMRHFALKEFQFEVDKKFILKSTIASICMALFIFWINPVGLLKVVTFIILGILVYGTLMFLFRAIGKKEIIFFKNLISNTNI